jgi:hypothetical protein
MGSFTSRFPDAVPDAGGGTHEHQALPFADTPNAGSQGDAWFAVLPSLGLDDIVFHKMRVLATNIAPPGARPIDGILGSDVLRNFDVVLDFPHDRIVLRENANFNKNFSTE